MSADHDHPSQPERRRLAFGASPATSDGTVDIHTPLTIDAAGNVFSTPATARIWGSFGRDNTPSIVPARLVTSCTGSSAYPLMVRYNNYAGYGTGDGQNEAAIIEAFVGRADRYRPGVPQ